jgi:hypothetical protein
MPRDSSGNYTLPLGNPVIDGTVIDVNWANPTMSDIAVQLNNVLTRDGLLSPTGAMYFTDGTPALPGIAFASAHGTGFWRDPTQMGVSWQGATKQIWNAAGSTAIGSLVIDDGFLTANRYAAPSVFLAKRADGAYGAPVAVAGGQIDGMWITRAYDGVAYRDIANISMINAAAPAAGSSPGFITFNTTPVGSNAPAERMRITELGNVGIGDGTGGAPAALLDIFKGAVASAVPALRLLSNNGGFSPGSYAGLAYYWNLSAGAAESTLVYGNTTNSFLAFGHHNGTSYSERMRIDAAGNVGIGTSTPDARLGVGNGILKVHFDRGNYADIFGSMQHWGDGFQGFEIANINQSVQRSIVFANGASLATRQERMRIDTAGNVGIGTSNPVAKLDIATPASTEAIRISGTGSFIGFYRTDLSNRISYIQTIETGLNYAVEGAGRNHIWIAGGAERMRIDAAGRVLIGATTPISPAVTQQVSYNGATNWAYASHLSGGTGGTVLAILDAGGATVGSITQSAVATSYNTTSDYRRKSAITDLRDSGSFIDALRPRTWSWADGSPGIGFVAHELQVVASGSVTGEKDAVDDTGKPIYQQVAYGSAEIIANLVAAVKDLRQRVANLGG